MESNLWFVYAVVTMLFWGVWGAFIERPEKNGFPATLGYAVWALTMVPCALVALAVIGWVPEHRPALGRSWARRRGSSGAAGQLVLFDALRRGPAYLVFPVVSLSPVVSVFLSRAPARRDGQPARLGGDRPRARSPCRCSPTSPGTRRAR